METFYVTSEQMNDRGEAVALFFGGVIASKVGADSEQIPRRGVGRKWQTSPHPGLCMSPEPAYLSVVKVTLLQKHETFLAENASKAVNR